MALWQWSTTPANNATSAPPINWAEGMAPGLVDDSARQMMADVASWFQGPEWLNYGLTPTYVSGTQFTLTGNQTAIYSVGRRVRAFVTAGTIYGSISASAFTTLTTVTVTWDSGNLDSGLSEVDVGLLNPLYQSLPSLSGLTVGGLSQLSGGPSWTASLWKRSLQIPLANAIEFAGGASKNFGMGNSGGTLYIFNTPDEGTSSPATYLSTLDSSGNLVITGNITANSDERIKKDWADLPSDFIERLAAVKCGTYTRTDTGARQIGVGAQSLQPVAPEAIGEGADGTLSVAYGQAALAACVELAKEVMRLRALLEPVK